MIRLYNTFELVIPLWKNLVAKFAGKNVEVEAVVSGGVYRKNHERGDIYLKFLWIPSFLKKKKIWCHIFYYLTAPFSILRRKSSLNIFFTQPPLFFIVGSFFSRLVKTPYIIHVMDMHPDMLGALNIVSKESFAYRFLDRMAVHSYKKAEKIVVIGDCMKSKLLKRGIDKNKINLIPNYTFSAIRPIEDDENKFLREHNLQDNFLILYSGNMGKPHEFETILSVAQDLKEYKDIKFIFVGGGAKYKKVQNSAEGNNNVLTFDYQPIELLPSILSAADIHFISLRRDLSGILVPSKFYSSLATAKAVVFEGDRACEVAQVIDQNNCGTVVEPKDYEGLKEAILSYYNDGDKCKRFGNNGYELYHKQYDSKIATEKYFSLIKGVKKNNIAADA